MNNPNNTNIKPIQEAPGLDVQVNSRLLDPNVFEISDDRPPRLFPAIRTQIMVGIRDIEKIIDIRDDVVIIDSVLINQNKEGPINIYVPINKSDLTNLTIEDLQYTIKHLNGKLAVLTLHPIRFYVVTEDFNIDKAKAIYDITNDKWIKIPPNEVVEEKNKFHFRRAKRKFHKSKDVQYRRPFYKELGGVEPDSARKHSAKPLERGTNRKTLSVLTRRYHPHHGFASIGINPSTEKLIKTAKKAPSGFVRRLTKMEVREIATKYKFNIPDTKKPIKHLGSTGIELIRKGPNAYYLVKTFGD